jgi:DNA mismatch repair protein MutL
MPRFALPPAAPPRGLYETGNAFLSPGPVAETAARSPDQVETPLGNARAQLHGTYILAETPSGIVLVDQHAAHERIVHERMKEALAARGVARQVLLLPEVVELDASLAARLVARADELAEFGLVLEGFGAGAVVVREVPALLPGLEIAALVRDLADELAEWDDALSLKERIESVCGTLACHTSVRAGNRLSQAEMDALLRQMEATPNSGQCNHGRPTYVTLALADIERLFGRR